MQEPRSEITTADPEQFLHELAELPHLPQLSAETLRTLHEQMSEEQILRYYSILGDHTSSSGSIALSPEQIIRPKNLYHASTAGDIAEFEPRERSKRSEAEPALVFGSPSQVVSSIFLVPTNDSFVKSGSYDHGRSWVYIVGDEERFRELDHGGYIYQLPESTFQVDPNLGLGLFEWTSAEPVKPQEAKHYTSGLQTMLDFGVKVYMVDQATFTRLHTENNDIEILKTLTPLSR